MSLPSLYFRNGEECLKCSHTDPWPTVNLIPQKGASLLKYQKHWHPDHDIINAHHDDVDAGAPENGDIKYSTPEEAINEENDEITFQLDETIELERENAKEKKKNTPGKKAQKEKEKKPNWVLKFSMYCNW